MLGMEGMIWVLLLENVLQMMAYLALAGIFIGLIPLDPRTLFFLETRSPAPCISIAVSHEGVIQDAGAKMIHVGKNTRSQIISKSIAHNGGNATYRGLVQISKSAINSNSEVVCDTLILDKISKSDTYPTEKVFNKSSVLKHEAKVTDLDNQKLFYLQSRGIDLVTAKQLLVLGFIEDFANELPLEYSVELNRLLKIDIK